MLSTVKNVSVESSIENCQVKLVFKAWSDSKTVFKNYCHESDIKLAYALYLNVLNSSIGVQ